MARGDTYVDENGKKFIDMTPTPEEYERTLRFIIHRTESGKDRDWAVDELIRIQPSLKAGRWV